MSPLHWALLVIGCVCAVEGRNFGRCDLARELRRQGFPRTHLQDWVCLVENESRGRTEVVAGPNGDGSYDYGLFQINSRYWCSTTSTPGKACQVRCKDLTTNDISRASMCAKRVYARHGFFAWNGWKRNCRGRLPDISMCGVREEEYNNITQT